MHHLQHNISLPYQNLEFLSAATVKIMQIQRIWKTQTLANFLWSCDPNWVRFRSKLLQPPGQEEAGGRRGGHSGCTTRFSASIFYLLRSSRGFAFVSHQVVTSYHTTPHCIAPYRTIFSPYRNTSHRSTPPVPPLCVAHRRSSASTGGWLTPFTLPNSCHPLWEAIYSSESQ